MPGNQSRAVALGGVLAALAVVIMCLGGLIPVTTFVCPMLCTMTQFLVLRFCGRRIAWAWFAVVAILSLLLGPDKEAAIVFTAIGYYPLIRLHFEKRRIPVLWKVLYFNPAIVAAYIVMIYVFGMQEIAEENLEFGMIGLVIILIMGNVVFFLLDKLLGLMARKLR